jgi:hypothetical protein
VNHYAMVEAASGKSYQEGHLMRDSSSHSGTGRCPGRGCAAVTSADGLQKSSCGPSTQSFTWVSSRKHGKISRKRPKRFLFLLTMLRRWCRVAL